VGVCPCIFTDRCDHSDHCHFPELAGSQFEPGGEYKSRVTFIFPIDPAGTSSYEPLSRLNGTYREMQEEKEYNDFHGVFSKRF